MKRARIHEPRSHADTASDGPRRQAGWAFAILVLIVPAGSWSAAADSWRQPSPTYAVWNEQLDIGEPTRLPPIEVVSYDMETTALPINAFSTFVGYDNGFVVANHGADRVSADDFPFLMRVNSWCPFRHTLFQSEVASPDQNSFSFERLRLVFAGHAFSPDLQYFFQFDGNSDSSTNSIFLDYFVTYDLGREVLGCEANRLGIKAGKWKVPFSRSREESGRRLQFADRATANLLFDLNRSIGAGLYGQIEPFSTPIHFETAVFNGFRTGSQSTNRANSEIDDNLGWSLRSFLDPIGEFGSDGEPDLSWHTAPALRIGGGLAYTRVDAAGTSEFSRQRVVDSGATLASLVQPLGVTAYDVWLYTLDAHFKYHGLSIIGEYYWRNMGRFDGGSVPALSDDGFVLQTGYFVCPHTLEVLFRWSRTAGDSGTLGLMDQSTDEVGAGLVWYIRGHNVKLTLDLTHVNGTPVSSPRLDLLPGDIGWMFRTQFQLAF